LQTPLAETLPPIYGDRIQLLQVIGNLMINPVEAYQRRRRRIAGIAHQHHQD
jgi:nitrogen-specific signal transduction histidine kinase